MNGRSCSSSAVSDRGMESDSVFHNLLGCMELLPGLHAVFAIPNMNALPVHCANQVYENVCFVYTKPYFLRFGRVSNRDYLVVFFLHVFYTSLFAYFC